MLGDTVVGSLARTEAAEPAIEETWTVATTLLHEIAVSTIGYGVLMWLGALLAGPTRAATAIRRFLAPYLREPGFAYGGLLLLLAIGILWWAPTPATRNPVTAILLAILIAIGFEGLRRLTAREFPDADRRVAEQHGRERLARATASVRQWASAATAPQRRLRGGSARTSASSSSSSSAACTTREPSTTTSSAPRSSASSVQQGLEGDEEPPDQAHRERVQDRGGDAPARQPPSEVAVEPDQPEPGPLRDREGRVELERARGREHEEDRREADPAGDRRRLLRDAAACARASTRAWVRVSVPMMSL